MSMFEGRRSAGRSSGPSNRDTPVKQRSVPSSRRPVRIRTSLRFLLKASRSNRELPSCRRPSQKKISDSLTELLTTSS